MGLGERRTRLHRLSRKLARPPEVMPYFVRRPERPEEPAPGWYMVVARQQQPIYLGYSAIDAELKLREMVG